MVGRRKMISMKKKYNGLNHMGPNIMSENIMSTKLWTGKIRPKYVEIYD